MLVHLHFDHLLLQVSMSQLSELAQPQWMHSMRSRRCVTPTKIGDRGCEKATVTSTHVVLECWTDGYAAEWKEIQELYPSLAPIKAGDMGYSGKASYFFSKTIRDAAWEAEGLNLDYYRGYNISWHDAAKYFDSPLAVNTSRLMRCNQTRLMISSVIKFYLEQTGDSGGVEVDGEDRYGRAWLALT